MTQDTPPPPGFHFSFCIITYIWFIMPSTLCPLLLDSCILFVRTTS